MWWGRGFPRGDTTREVRGDRGWREANAFTCSNLDKLVHSKERDWEREATIEVCS